MANEGQEIAIIGSGCRFPGDASSSSELWSLLRDPVSVASELVTLHGYYHENGQYHGHANVKEAYLLAGEDTKRRFDAGFFGISPAEANVLDPQIRLLLETVYEALEASGQTMDKLRGSDTAVYAGQMVNDYELIMYRDYENLGTYHATGTSRTMLSNRISYFFDWHGPSMTIDTACSSSLVALHHAVQQLRSGHSKVAVVAGSNLIYDPGTFIAESNLKMLSPEGRSRMWDIDANGYARGEGVAAMVLKMRHAAEADGDHIECVVRETALNQDGKTPGQTMPSASAQAQLIRDCYERAGLDLANPAHRPQYFEAHGTGTPAGDPIEAEAISSAFFPNGNSAESPFDPLLVGSIKTVIGHTEGTAGVAGLLKASLAIQNSTIPANLLFNQLNPRVEPFYHNLRIPTSQTPWPTLPRNSPRRISVNSFGFGGTNAHAIVESSPVPGQLSGANQPTSTVFTPFVFSAASEYSLKSYLRKFCDYLRNNNVNHNLRDIAYTLDVRRTRHSVATAVSASAVDELCTQLEEKLESVRANSERRVGVRDTRQSPGARKPHILGVFTGQGAQWAQMGMDLITKSAALRQLVERLQSRLDQLPAADRPSWSLVQELQKDPSSSRVMEAALSQPLCTAIQIVQVELIRAAGMEFSAVVGHSSGEIAAAYTAGLISAEDAICIAYYRGLHSGLSECYSGQKGAMMAVGTSAEDAQDLLDFPEFEGRACVAAVNSATSITLSGDEDAIMELKVIFEDEQKFVRILKVDTAYHSHHMRACSARYLNSIAALDIQISPGSRTRWFSSVYGHEMDVYDSLRGPYWDSNMVNPVFFMQAVESASRSLKSIDLAVELGPHPALKGPALQTMQDRLSHTVPYTGLFQRGISAIKSVAAGLGFAWMHLGKDAIQLGNYDKFVSGDASSILVKELPTYAWDHESEFWHESRYARAIRMRPDPVHELLGHLTPDSTEEDMRWRHILRLSEVQWLTNHRLQNIAVFPAAGYIVSVLEAAILLCRKSSATLIEILDIDILSALVFNHDDSSMEIILSLTNISRYKEEDKQMIEAEFKYHATSARDTGPLELKAAGRVRVHVGQPHDTVLPARTPRRPNLLPVRSERFYESILELGYQYAGPFKALERIERKLGAATGYISLVERTNHLIHPAALDAAFQSAFLTYAAPDDGAQRSMRIPRRIQRLIVNPSLCTGDSNNQTALAFDSAHTMAFPHTNMICDIDIYHERFDHAMIQIEGLECVTFSQQTVKDDVEVFSHVVWDVAEPDAHSIVCNGTTTVDQLELADDLSTYTAHLARVLRQVVHRYPHMHILEIQDDMTTATEAILREVAPKFASYTISAPTSESFDQSQAWLEMYKDKVSFKAFDISKEPRDQGFIEASYDLIVAPLSLSSAPDLEQILRNARRMLKPGGQLLALETSPSLSSSFGVVFAAGESRANSQATSLGEWDNMLRQTGFSGLDSSSQGEGGKVPLQVFVSQAVDDKIAYLRDPLALEFPSAASEMIIEDLVILSDGNSPRTTELATQLSALFDRLCGSTRIIHSFPDVLRIDLSPGTVVLCLADLDTKIFQQLNSVTWDAMKKLLTHAGTLVWVTQGRRADKPYANMILGLVRGSARDNPALDYLLLDIEDDRRLDHRTIARTVLRHKIAVQWQQPDILHLTVENELVVDKAGRFLIPRIMMDQEMNNRYNANNRDITTRLQPSLHPLAISASSTGWDVELLPPSPHEEGEPVRLQTTHSMLSPVRIAEHGCMFAVLGIEGRSGDKLITLSSSNSSLVRPFKDLYIPVGIQSGLEVRLLWLTAQYLLATVIFRGLSRGDKVLVLEPSSKFASVLIEVATLFGVCVTFITTNLEASRAKDPRWKVIHPAASKRTIAQLARGDFAAFVQMTPQTKTESIGNCIDSTLPAHCRKENLESLFGKAAWSPAASHLGEIHTRLVKAVEWATSVVEKEAGHISDHIHTLGVNSITEQTYKVAPLTIVDWTKDVDVSINVRPIDSQVLFPDNKTYWLVGLTGGLGLSLCEWMVQRGARHFVISSRKPNVESAWEDEMRAKGVVVRISPCDITQRDQVVALHAEICSSMPAIAGVAQGVMVLHDTAVQDMALEQLLSVTKPKVEGSIYLNDLFQENTLDFFIFFSSAASLNGNHGQANYAAANTFMASLAEQRRKRGLAASIINIGPIFGVGYISRAAEGSVMGNVTMQTGGFVGTSERDFHQLFGEAVLAGRLGSTSSIELVSGLRKISQGEEYLPSWGALPRFSHFVLGREGAEDAATAGSEANIPIKDQLAKAHNSDQVHDIIWDAFTRQLISHFQLNLSQISKTELGAMRFDQMGIDSLTAVEIRGWFMRTLQVNIPVLKILNGGFVSELVTIATETIPSRLVPNLDGVSVEEVGSPASATSDEIASSTDTDPDSPADYGQETSSGSNFGSVQEPAITARSGLAILKSVPVSFTQARFYPSGLFLEDKVGLNHTAWARITGPVDADMLRQAVHALGQEHEILRTAFFDHNENQMQHILETTVMHLEHQHIDNEEEVNRIAMSIQKGYVYDVACGETIRVLLLTRSETENFLVIGAHPLVLDATSIQTFLKWLAFHYAYPQAKRQVKQFAEASEERHTDYAAGRYEAELQFWRNEFATPPPPLPLVSLTKVEERPVLKAYENIIASCRIGVETKLQISKICRRLRATPFHFYLAALRALLLRYTVGGEDVTMAVAESGRSHDAEDMDVLGPLYNLVLVRLLNRASNKFEDVLEAARDKTYTALSNSKLPYPVLVRELELQRNAKYFPFFQVFADYRMGQRETMAWGDKNELILMGFDLNVPYDVYLDTIDEPDGECVHHLFLRGDMFDRPRAERLASSYKRLIQAFAANPRIAVDEVDLSEP